MNDEKWYKLVNSLTAQFKVLGQKKEDVFYENPLTNKKEKIGQSEEIIFIGPDGAEQKVERTQKKITIDRKMHYHKTKSDAVIEQVFSPDEYGDTIKFYKKIDEDWREIQM